MPHRPDHTDRAPVQTTGPQPRLQRWPATATEALVLVLHGGRATSHEPARRSQLAYRRMVPFAHAIHRGGHGRLAVWQLQNRLRGWNEPDLDPVTDARWALGEAEAVHPGVPVVLLGHSMGGRAALRLAGEPAVVAVCALAPWIGSDEPVAQLTGRPVLIAHGTADRWTDPRASFAYAVRARAVTERIARFELAGTGHTMLRRARLWTQLASRFTLAAAGLRPADPTIEAAMATPAPDGLRMPIVRGRAL